MYTNRVKIGSDGRMRLGENLDGCSMVVYM
jgi:hypothetical protein